MLKAILMSIGVTVLIGAQANAGVIYNWRTENVQRGAAMAGQIEFTEKSVRAGRATAEFTGFGQIPAGSPGDPPTFFYPTRDGDGEVDLDPDVLGLTFSILDIAGGTLNLNIGENRGLFFQIFADVTFSEEFTPAGVISVRGEFSGYGLGGASASAPLWTAQYGSDGACFLTCVSTGTWVLDTASFDVPEPGSLIMVLTGVLGFGISYGRRNSLRL
jgi:hypothetical protein